MNYNKINDSEDKLLLLLHGNSIDSQYFSPLFQKIIHWKMIAPDFPGHGLSSKLDKSKYSIEKYLSEIKNIIQKENPRVTVVIGHSLGGHVAIQLMNEVKINGLFLIATPPISFTDGRLPYNKSLEFKSSGDDEKDRATLISLLADFDVTKDSLNYVLESILQTDPIFRDILAEDFQQGKFKDEIEILKKNSDVKIGLLRGKKDSIANNEYFTDVLMQIKKEKEYLLNNSGHFPMLDEPEKCVEVITDFLRTWDDI